MKEGMNGRGVGEGKKRVRGRRGGGGVGGESKE